MTCREINFDEPAKPEFVDVPVPEGFRGGKKPITLNEKWDIEHTDKGTAFMFKSEPTEQTAVKEDAPRILDSGNRRQFESGAVRDIQEGKGRCDLLPLDVVAKMSNSATFAYINSFQETNDISNLHRALSSSGVFHDVYTMILEVSKHFEEGAKKYGDNNWRKGIPVRCYIDSAVRHYLKFLRGDKDEPHDRAFCWNIMCAIWTCKHHPELNEYASKEE